MTTFAVVIPAKNEADLLPRCLESVTAAIEELRHRHPDPSPEVEVIVVADECNDDTAAIAAAHGAIVVRGPGGGVGLARAAGVAASDAAWIANTDADSVVPTDWLVVQSDFASKGVDVLRGAVEPDRAAMPEWAWEAWWGRHTRDEEHPYIYGANLGIRRTTYDELGGFAAAHESEDARVEHEDVALVHAAERAGCRVVSTARGRVVTSPRLDSRCREGFGANLAALLVEAEG